MVRVANVIEEGKLGGPQVRMVRVAAALKERVDTFIIMPAANSGRFRDLCEMHDISYRVIPISRITRELLPALGYVFFSIFEIFRLARVFKNERVDLVHVSGGSWQFKGVIAAKLAGKPVIWHLNDTYVPVFIRRVFRFVARLADGFIFASHATFEYYRNLCSHSGEVRIVPSIVEFDHFDKSKVYSLGEDAKLVDEWGNDLVVGTIANVSPIKDFETFIRAAAALPSHQGGRKLRFVIVGPISSSQRVYYKRLLALGKELGVETCEFVGGRNDVRPILSRIDVYVCSSRAESSPISVWEAMAMRRAIVSTDVGDVKRHIIDGESGFVLPVGDFTAIARRVNELASDSEMRARFGEKARATAEEVFSPDRISALTFGAYCDVLSQINEGTSNKGTLGDDKSRRGD